MARALGGDVIGRDRVAAPGPGHSAPRPLARRHARRQRAGRVCLLFVMPVTTGTSCKDYVRERLGLPQWQPGDGRDRRVEPSRLRAFDRAAVNAESERRERTEDDLIRIARARAIWDAAADPRGTLAEHILRRARSCSATTLLALSCVSTRARLARRGHRHDDLPAGADRGLPQLSTTTHYGDAPHPPRSTAALAEDRPPHAWRRPPQCREARSRPLRCCTSAKASRPVWRRISSAMHRHGRSAVSA